MHCPRCQPQDSSLLISDCYPRQNDPKTLHSKNTRLKVVIGRYLLQTSGNRSHRGERGHFETTFHNLVRWRVLHGLKRRLLSELVVSFAAVMRVVTALRDDPNNGCEGD